MSRSNTSPSGQPAPTQSPLARRSALAASLGGLLGRGLGSRVAKVAGTASAAMAAASALAQSGNGRIIVGFSAGGALDLLARQVAEGFGQRLGKPYIVENKLGAAGRIAIDAVRSAKPDGDTLLICPQGPLTLFPHVFNNLRYDPSRDLSLIARLTVFDVAIGIGPASGTDSLARFLAWARANPSKANYGSSGAGTLLHFSGVALAQGSGIPMTHVPYKGAAPAVADLMAGAVPMVVAPMSDMLENHRAGRLKIVAICSAQRTPLAPEVPTLKEAGIDVEVPGWYALCGPAGMTPALQKTIHQAAAHLMDQPAVKDRMLRLGMQSAVLDPQQTAQAQQRELRMWAPMVKASGFTPED